MIRRRTPKAQSGRPRGTTGRLFGQTVVRRLGQHVLDKACQAGIFPRGLRQRRLARRSQAPGVGEGMHGIDVAALGVELGTLAQLIGIGNRAVGARAVQEVQRGAIQIRAGGLGGGERLLGTGLRGLERTLARSGADSGAGLAPVI